MSDNPARLKLRFADLFTEGSPVDTIILIDESSSISAQLFEIQKNSVRNLVLLMPLDPTKPYDITPVRVCVMTYSHQVGTIIDFDSSPGNICCSISKLKSNGGGTNLDLALKAAKNHFDTNPRTGAKRVIFVLTDDDVSSAKDTATIMIADKKVQIFVLCATRLTEKQQLDLANVASPGCCFYFPNGFTEVLQMFNTMQGATSTSPPTLGIIDREPCSIVFTIEHAASEEAFSHFEIKIFNNLGEHLSVFSTKDSKSPNNRVQRICDLAPGQDLAATVRAFLKEECTWTKWSDKKLNFTTMRNHPERPIFASPKSLEKETLELAKRLSTYKPPEDIAQIVSVFILLPLGKIGKGKTSVLNTILSALLGTYSARGIVSESLKSVTRIYESDPGAEGFALDLRDIFGEENSNYDTILKWIVGGNLAPGIRLSATSEEVVQNLVKCPEIGQMVHAVFLVFATTSISTPSEISTVRKIYETLIEEGVQPIVLLTKVDLLYGSKVTQDKVDLIYEDSIVDSAISTFCKEANIQPSDVFPIVNYTGPYRKRDFAREKLALNALDAALRQAETRVRRLIKQKRKPMSCSSIRSSDSPLCSTPTKSAPHTPQAKYVSSPSLPSSPDQPLSPSTSSAAVRLFLCSDDDPQEENVSIVEVAKPLTLAGLQEAIADEVDVTADQLSGIFLSAAPRKILIKTDKAVGRIKDNDMIIYSLRAPYGKP